jgi:16S rRNA (uracil1498-N3)-methyltransferase
MRLHRFIGNFNFAESRLKIFDKEILDQIKNVLRLGAGEKIILSDGNLNEALAQINNFKKDYLEVEILEVGKNENEPKVRAVLYCSILKRENFELAAQKAVEVGIAEIVPIVAKRTVKLNLKEERLKKIIREAAEQSGRGRVPVLQPVIDFAEAVEEAEKNNVNLFFDVSGKNIKNFFDSHFRGNDRETVGVFIGPEGGWDEEEIKMARNKNFKIVSLGRLTLRAETAAAVASYVVASN